MVYGLGCLQLCCCHCWHRCCRYYCHRPSMYDPRSVRMWWSVFCEWWKMLFVRRHFIDILSFFSIFPWMRHIWSLFKISHCLPGLKRFGKHFRSMLKRQHRCSRIHIINTVNAPVSCNSLNIPLRFQHVHFMVGHHMHAVFIRCRRRSRNHHNAIAVRLVCVLYTVCKLRGRFFVIWNGYGDGIFNAASILHVCHEFGESWKEFGIDWFVWLKIQ